jgi:hypothetical protein
MRTVAPAFSPLEEARTKIEEELAILVEVVHRLPPEAEEMLRPDAVIAANHTKEAQTAEELRVGFCQAMHDLSLHLRSFQDSSHVARKLRRWLLRVEDRIAKEEAKTSHDWLRFLQKWPRIWKASLLSILGLFDMGVWVGDAIERQMIESKNTTPMQMKQEKARLIRCWGRVEQGIDAENFSALHSAIRRVRRERERNFLKDLPRLKNPTISIEEFDVGYAERALGLEEFLLKVMIEMAAKTIHEEGRIATGQRHFEAVRQLIHDHIKMVGENAAELSAMNLVHETVEAEIKYLAAVLAWGKNKSRVVTDDKALAQRNKDLHAAHCAVIDAYMELSDCTSLRGVMLCYELPVFTQLLYDQRKALDRRLEKVA